MSLGRHTLVNLGGVLVPMVVALVTVPAYLRSIGAERFGVLAVLWSLLTYFSFLDLGLGRAVTQRLARFSDSSPRDRGSIVWTGFLAALFMGIAGSVLIFLVAKYGLAALAKMSPASSAEAERAIGWLAVAFPLLLAGTVLAGALQARLQFVEVSLIQMFGNTLAQALPLGVASAGFVELAYLVPVVMGCRVLTICLLYIRCVKHVPLRGWPRPRRRHLGPLLGYGGWMSVMSFLSPFLMAADRLVISAVTGARAVTFYTVPYDLVARTMILSGSLSSALFPRLAALDVQQGRALTAAAAETLLSVMTPTIVVGLLVTDPFLRMWISSDFAASSRGVAEIILVGIWFNALVIPHHARYLATESPRNVALVFALEIPIYLLLLWLGVTHWGVQGAACAWTARVLLDTVLLLWLNQALSTAFRQNIRRFAVVLVAFGVVLVPLSTGVRSVGVAGVAVLLALQVYCDRRALLSAYRSVRRRPARG